MTVFIVLCLVVALFAYAVVAFTAWSEREVDRHVERALAYPLPDVDATDAEFEHWARQALGIANSAAFEADVRADIAALPTTKETA